MTDKLRHGPLWTTIFAIISLIWIYPIALVFINSFKKRVYISKDVFSLPTGDTFVGLENYERGIERRISFRASDGRSYLRLGPWR